MGMRLSKVWDADPKNLHGMGMAPRGMGMRTSRDGKRVADACPDPFQGCGMRTQYPTLCLQAVRRSKQNIGARRDASFDDSKDE